MCDNCFFEVDVKSIPFAAPCFHVHAVSRTMSHTQREPAACQTCRILKRGLLSTDIKIILPYYTAILRDMSRSLIGIQIVAVRAFQRTPIVIDAGIVLLVYIAGQIIVDDIKPCNAKSLIS